jgi:hypothetical protein
LKMLPVRPDHQDFQRIESILKCDNEAYGQIHPEINRPDVFSISRLSASNGNGSALNDKLRLMNGNNMGFRANIAMTRGKAIHEFIQKRLVSFQIEREILFQPVGRNYWLLGHIDAISFKLGILYDFKNTSQLYGSYGYHKLIENGKIQVGTYCKILELQNTTKVTGNLAIIANEGLFMYSLENFEVEEAYNTIIVRADTLYAELVKRGVIK